VPTQNTIIDLVLSLDDIADRIVAEVGQEIGEWHFNAMASPGRVLSFSLLITKSELFPDLNIIIRRPWFFQNESDIDGKNVFASCSSQFGHSRS
jgi:hypothetical protein